MIFIRPFFPGDDIPFPNGIIRGTGNHFEPFVGLTYLFFNPFTFSHVTDNQAGSFPSKSIFENGRTELARKPGSIFAYKVEFSRQITRFLSDIQ